MLKSSARSAIRLRGVRQNNLKDLDLDLPLNQLVVVTGLSGSGKSSLAFDTLFAEGQRRYIETFSPYARQFLDRMDKPQVDTVEGIPPAIAIEQRNAVKTTRSTVGTMTEICDYMKMLWPHISQLHCRQCGRAVRKDSPQAIWKTLQGEMEGTAGAEHKEQENRTAEVLITFDLPLTEKLSLEECLTLVARQGYQRLLVDGEMVRLEEAGERLGAGARIRGEVTPGGAEAGAGAGEPGSSLRLAALTVVQDRVTVAPQNRARFIEACEQAYHFGKGKLAIRPLGRESAVLPPRRFSNRLHCAECDLEYQEPSPALFSFNHPVGACPTCRGFGRVISIDYHLALPDRSKTLAQGVVKPWQTGLGIECQEDLMRVCRRLKVPTDIAFSELPKSCQELVIEGEPGYGKDPAHEWPHAWYGIKGYFRWLESKAYKMHVRVLLSRYRAYTPCPDCGGKRFKPDALLYRLTIPREARQGPLAQNDSLTIADFYQLPVRDSLRVVRAVAARFPSRANDGAGIVLKEVTARLGFLEEVGLGYLTLDRPTRSLSGGETERVNLTTCLGTRLVNTLFVLDEPSVGLHPRDTERLIRILQRLRDSGNTLVVVEHEASVIRAANHIIDLGPGHGASGGEIVFQGSFREILEAPESLTGKYLSGRSVVEVPARRRVVGRGTPESAMLPRNGKALALAEARAPYRIESERPGRRTPAEGRHAAAATPALRLSHATRHNLRDLSVAIPLGRFVCVTGVSGSGKTTLVREVLLPALVARLQGWTFPVQASERFKTEANGEEEENGPGGETGSEAMLEGAEQLGRVVLVDQSILGKTPRSNPAVYIGAFDDIRELFAQSEVARRRGLNASAFSFNSAQGQCERCRGAGFEKIEMQFLSDVFIRCPECNGRRYRSHILEVKVAPGKNGTGRTGKQAAAGAFSIADLLETTVEEAIAFLETFAESKPARRAREALQWLQETGLGYLKLGQPINTLSGGESQRLKLVKHLAESFAGRAENGRRSVPEGTAGQGDLAPTLFLFDEPTTGLHFDDVRVLLQVFQRLVEAGHSVLVIEHNLDVIKSADWVIDLGPDAGDEGGQLVAEGTPEEVARCEASHTGRALRQVLGLNGRKERQGVSWRKE